jgi:hypothetical protein
MGCSGITPVCCNGVCQTAFDPCVTTIYSGGATDGGLPTPKAIAVDAHNVYWTASSGTTFSVPIAGGAATSVASQGPGAGGLAVDDTNLYAGYGNTVLQAPVGGGSSMALSPIGPGSAMGVATNCPLPPASCAATTVYWGMSTGPVMKVTLVGDVLSTLTPGSGPAQSVAVDPSGNVYWTTSTRTLLTVPVAGGTPTTLASWPPPASAEIQGLAVDAANVYWTTGAGMLSVAIGGGTPVTLAPAGEGIALDSGNVYWGTWNGTTGAIVTVAKQGSMVTTLATGTFNPVGVAVDATNVYWIDASQDRVMMVTPK